MLQPCLLTANCSRRTDICIPEGLHPSQATWCPGGTGAAPQLPFSLTACGPAPGDLPLFSNIWPLSVLPCSCPCSLCSPSPYLPQPCSKMRFQSHLLHAVFLDLQCDVEQSLLWTSESPNLSFCPPLLGTSFILPPRWFSLLLKWKLSELRGHVTDSTLYPQGSTQELVCYQCRWKGGKGKDGRHRLTEPWTHVSMFWPQYLLTRRTPLGWGYKKISPGTSLVIQWLRLCSQCREPRVNPWLGN